MNEHTQVGVTEAVGWVMFVAGAIIQDPWLALAGLTILTLNTIAIVKALTPPEK